MGLAIKKTDINFKNLLVYMFCALLVIGQQARAVNDLFTVQFRVIIVHSITILNGLLRAITIMNGHCNPISKIFEAIFLNNQTVTIFQHR